jgi:hypothetical protein
MNRYGASVNCIRDSYDGGQSGFRVQDARHQIYRETNADVAPDYQVAKKAAAATRVRHPKG